MTEKLTTQETSNPDREVAAAVITSTPASQRHTNNIHHLSVTLLGASPSGITSLRSNRTWRLVKGVIARILRGTEAYLHSLSSL